MVGIPVSRENAIHVMRSVHRARCAALGGHDFGVSVVELSEVPPDVSYSYVACRKCGHEAVERTPGMFAPKRRRRLMLWSLVTSETRRHYIRFRCKTAGHQWEEQYPSAAVAVPPMWG